MVGRCSKAGVSIIADAVINHAAAGPAPVFCVVCRGPGSFFSSCNYCRLQCRTRPAAASTDQPYPIVQQVTLCTHEEQPASRKWCWNGRQLLWRAIHGRLEEASQSPASQSRRTEQALAPWSFRNPQQRGLGYLFSRGLGGTPNPNTLYTPYIVLTYPLYT